MQGSAVRGWVWIGLGVAIVSSLVLFSRQNKGGASPRPAEADPDVVRAAAALTQIRGSLRNPAALTLVSASISKKGDICLELMGQNAFGALNGSSSRAMVVGTEVNIAPGEEIWALGCSPYNRQITGAVEAATRR